MGKNLGGGEGRGGRGEKGAQSMCMKLQQGQAGVRGSKSDGKLLTLLSVFPHRYYYSPYSGYSQSKLANILFTYELQKRLEERESPVTANAVHPGVVNTDLFQHIPWIMRMPQNVLAYFLFKVRFRQNIEKISPSEAYLGSPDLNIADLIAGLCCLLSFKIHRLKHG